MGEGQQEKGQEQILPTHPLALRRYLWGALDGGYPILQVPLGGREEPCCHLLAEISPSAPPPHFTCLLSPSQSYSCSILLQTTGLAQGTGETRAYLDAQPFACIFSHPSLLPSVVLRVLSGSCYHTDTIHVRTEWPREQAAVACGARVEKLVARHSRFLTGNF